MWSRLQFDFSYPTFYLYYFLIPKMRFLLYFGLIGFLASALTNSNNSKINYIVLVLTFIVSLSSDVLESS